MDVPSDQLSAIDQTGQLKWGDEHLARTGRATHGLPSRLAAQAHRIGTQAQIRPATHTAQQQAEAIQMQGDQPSQAQPLAAAGPQGKAGSPSQAGSGELPQCFKDSQWMGFETVLDRCATAGGT